MIGSHQFLYEYEAEVEMPPDEKWWKVALKHKSLIAFNRYDCYVPFQRLRSPTYMTTQSV